MSTTLEIGSRREGSEAGVLSLKGEVDVANAHQVRDAALKLVSEGVRLLVVDLSGIEYMDSAGLGVLVAIHKRLREQGGSLAVAGPQPRVGRLFEITGLSQVFAVREDAAAALKEVGG